MEYVYLTHSALELVLGAIKLRGRYQHEAVGSRLPRSEMYTRHHGASILSLALLSWLVYSAGEIHSAVGRGASLVLAVFHGGAVLSFLYAYAHGAIPISKVIIPHTPYALAFAWHAGTPHSVR